MVPSFSRDETRVAIVDGKDAVVLDVETGQPLLRIEAHGDWANNATFSPDGRFLATGGADGAVRFWDASISENGNRRPIKWLLSEGTIYELGFLPDGKRLAASSEDGKVRVWDVSFLQDNDIAKQNDHGASQE